MIKMPKTTLGKWSVGLNALFLIEIVSSIIIFVKVLGLSFDDQWHGVHWWGRVVVTAFPASIIALFTGIRAVRKNKERSVLVFLSILIGLCVMLFLIFHSLFIND